MSWSSLDGPFIKRSEAAEPKSGDVRLFCLSLQQRGGDASGRDGQNGVKRQPREDEMRDERSRSGARPHLEGVHQRLCARVKKRGVNFWPRRAVSRHVFGRVVKKVQKQKKRVRYTAMAAMTSLYSRCLPNHNNQRSKLRSPDYSNPTPPQHLPTFSLSMPILPFSSAPESCNSCMPC